MWLVSTYNPSIQETWVGELCVRGQDQLYNETQISQQVTGK